MCGRGEREERERERGVGRGGGGEVESVHRYEVTPPRNTITSIIPVHTHVHVHATVTRSTAFRLDIATVCTNKTIL